MGIPIQSPQLPGMGSQDLPIGAPMGQIVPASPAEPPKEASACGLLTVEYSCSSSEI